MATKKEETVSMIDTFREFKDTKNIDRTTLVSVLEESFRNVLAKIFGSDEGRLTVKSIHTKCLHYYLY